MKGRPEPGEAAPYYFRYIDRIREEDILARLESQLPETLAFLGSISEERSLHRYAKDRWSIRQVWSHVSDTERVFQHRAFWFARGFESEMPSFDQDPSAATARADDFTWRSHVEDFEAVRRATLTLYRNLPRDAWLRAGVASGNRVTVRALAWIAAGHTAHHRAVLEERYLGSNPAAPGGGEP